MTRERKMRAMEEMEHKEEEEMSMLVIALSTKLEGRVLVR